jgi:hypothetical protein
MDSLMIATRGLCAVSRSLKSRPDMSGIPTVEKYAGATQLLFNWMPPFAPSMTKPLEYEQFVISPQVVTDADTTPGTDSIDVSSRSTSGGSVLWSIRCCQDRWSLSRVAGA